MRFHAQPPCFDVTGTSVGSSTNQNALRFGFQSLTNVFFLIVALKIAQDTCGSGNYFLQPHRGLAVVARQVAAQIDNKLSLSLSLFSAKQEVRAGFVIFCYFLRRQ